MPSSVVDCAAAGEARSVNAQMAHVHQGISTFDTGSKQLAVRDRGPGRRLRGADRSSAYTLNLLITNSRLSPHVSSVRVILSLPSVLAPRASTEPGTRPPVHLRTLCRMTATRRSEFHSDMRA